MLKSASPKQVQMQGARSNEKLFNVYKSLKLIINEKRTTIVKKKLKETIKYRTCLV